MTALVNALKMTYVNFGCVSPEALIKCDGLSSSQQLAFFNANFH